MADVNAEINVNIDTSGALSQLKALQREIARFHASVAKSSDQAALAQRDLQKNFLNGVNAIQGFSAELRTVKTTAENFTHSLEKNKFSMREYFRFAGASTKTFGRMFSSEFDTINKVAVENVKRLQTQYIKMGRDASGAMRAIAIMPTELNMSDLSTKTQIAAQKQAIFNQLVKQGSTNLLNFGKNTQWAGRQLMVGFTLPLMGLGAVASKTFMEMETAAIKFKKVYGDLFTAPEETQFALESIQMLGREFTKYGIAVADTVTLAAEAAAAGFAGSELQAQVAQATRLQVLGQVDQQKALETTISLSNAFGIAATDLADAINFLNSVENQTVVSLDDITTAIPKAAPVVKQLGGDVKDLAFFMAAMKEGGINASEGANALKSGLASLINPTDKARGMLKDFGIDIDSIVNKNAGNVKQTVIEFAEALDGLSNLNRQRAIEQLFGKFQLARLSTLFENVIKDGNQASRVLDLASASVEELASLAEKELGLTANSAMNKFRKAVEDVKASLAPVGEVFLQIITPLLDKLGSLLDWFNSLSDSTKKTIAKVVFYLGGLAPVILMTIGLMANFVANGIKGLMLLRNGFLRLSGQSKILGEQTQYLTVEQQNAVAAAASLEQSHIRLQQAFTGEAGAARQLITEYQRMIAAQNTAAARFPGMMQPGFKPKKYAKGVVSVPGPKGAGDVVPAMLSPGEAVIPAKMVEKYGGLINGMIADNIPGFNDGLGANTNANWISMIASRGSDARSRNALAPYLAAEISKIMQEVGPELVTEFKDFMETTTSEMEKVTKKSLDKALKEQRIILEQYSPASYNMVEGKQFAHIGSGIDVTAANLQASGAVTHQKTLDRLAELTRVLPDKKLGIKTGFGFDVQAQLNNLMGSTGADLESVINDFNSRGVEKWKTMVKVGGGNLEELSGDLQRYGGEISNLLQRRLQAGASIIVDSTAQVEQARATALAAGKSFDSTTYVVMEQIEAEARTNLQMVGTRLNDVIETALRTITEVRLNLTAQEDALLGGGFLGVDKATGKPRLSGRIDATASSTYRRFGGVGTINPELQASAIATTDGLIETVRERAGVNSPSVRTIPIGEDIARGLQVGMLNQVDETAAVASRLSSVASGLINPRTGRPFTEKEIADLRRVKASDVKGMVGRGGQVAFLGMPSMPDDGRNPADNAEKAGRKKTRRVATRAQGPAAIGPQAPVGAMMLPIVSELTRQEKRRERLRSARGSVVGGIRNVSGRVSSRATGAGGMLGISGLMFGLSMLPGKFGQLAQSIMPVVFGLQALSVVTKLIGGLPTVLIAVVAGLYLFNKSAIKAAEEIADAAKMEAEARYGSVKSIEEFAEFTGRALPSAREFSRNNRQLIAASGEAVKRFAEFYGKKGNRATQVINAAAMRSPDAGLQAAAIDVAQRAAIFGLGPADIAANIKAASDLIGADQVDLKARIQTLLAPNGQDITKEPLTIKARMEFLQEESTRKIESIGTAIKEIGKIELTKTANTIFGTKFDYQSLKKAAGAQQSIDKSFAGGLGGNLMGAAKQTARFINPTTRRGTAGFLSLPTADVKKEFTKLQEQIQNASVQISSAFVQEKEALGLLNAQYADGVISKEEYDAAFALSFDNFDSLESSTRGLIKQLDKIDSSGELASLAVKDFGNQALGALKKTNPELFKKISDSLSKIDKNAQIDIYMGFAKGSLTLLDLAKIPDVLDKINGKTYTVALKIIGESGLSAGGAAILTVAQAQAEVDRISKLIKGQPRVAGALARQLAQAKKDLEAAKKAEADAAKVNQKGNLDTDVPDGKTAGSGDGKFVNPYERELDLLREKRDALKDINDELDRQNQYQMKQLDLINQAARAKMTGDYLQAASLQQQSMLEGARFARESKIVQMDRIAGITEKKSSLVADTKKVTSGDRAFIKKLQAGDYSSIVPMPTTPNIGFGTNAMGTASTTNYGGSVYNVTMNVTGSNAEEISNKVLAKLKLTENKNNKTNKVAK